MVRYRWRKDDAQQALTADKAAQVVKEVRPIGAAGGATISTPVPHSSCRMPTGMVISEGAI